MGAMLAAGGLINGGALLGMLSDTHTHTLIFSSKSHRTEGHTGGDGWICVCENAACVGPAKQATDRLSSDLLQLVIVQMCVRACE